MESFVREFERLRIRLEDINLATNNFDQTMVIGSGGFGSVYKGILSCIKGRCMVAIKRLDRRLGQGSREFWEEIKILNHRTHENLVALSGFCFEGGEMILVYEYAPNGSLDRHISSMDFTWIQRLKICLDAARGLCYLHDAQGGSERVIHRDIKSSNILLDANWKARVSDMGLSKITPANQQHTGLFTNPAGTLGYCDPLYYETCYLTKESDVYSFGVVLFEVLCGRLCCAKRGGQYQVFVPKWKNSYEQNKLQDIIFADLKEQIDQTALQRYSDIAYKCLQRALEDRPTMAIVVKELETALAYQEHYEEKLSKNYKEMLLTVADPLCSRSESELKTLLPEGILINNGKTWFSRNIYGDHCEMISIAACLTSTASESQHYISSPEYTERFAVGCYEPLEAIFNTHVATQFLSPRVTYTVNLVFKRKNSNEQYIGLEYKLEGEADRSYAYLSDKREDGWLTAELYHFTSDQKTVDLEIWFYTKHCPNILVEGIGFQPVKKVEHEVLTAEMADMQPISDTETYWEQKLPIDYEEIVKWSKGGVQWRTKKELYYILREGFLVINSGEEWFSLAKDGKKCLMLSAKAVLKTNQWKWDSKPETRFRQVADCISEAFSIFCKFSSKMLSPQTPYAAFLVYELPDDYCKTDNPPVQVVDENSDSGEEYNIYLRTPQTPVIIRGSFMNERSYNPSIRPKIKGLPKLRSDGWMEVQVHEFQTLANINMISTHLRFSSYDMSLAGITVQGLEFRPI